MKRTLFQVGLLFATLIFMVSLCVPQLADAQSRRGSSAYRSKINKLDNDRVEKLPLPILFGVSLSQIWPNFGDDRDGGSRSHEGLDIMAPEGAPIVSPTEAVVTRTGTGSGSGKYVTTANPGGETFTYMHLSEIEVEAGDELEVGDLIGLVGNTGSASGGAAHLHFEIRENREATDPYKRIKIEFTLKEKIEFLENALKSTEDEDELVEFVIKNYASELRLAQTAGIELPDDIVGELLTSPVIPSFPGTISNSLDLDLGSTGAAVTTLQNFLIKEAIGPSAQSLAVAGATGYFGPLTQRALAEYQAAHSISPAAGYYGPKTRAYIEAQR